MKFLIDLCLCESLRYFFIYSSFNLYIKLGGFIRIFLLKSFFLFFFSICNWNIKFPKIRWKGNSLRISSLGPGLRTNRVGREQNGNFAHDEWDANLKFQFFIRKYISITLLETSWGRRYKRMTKNRRCFGCKNTVIVIRFC